MPATIDTIANECLAVRVRLLSRVVTGIYHGALRPVGLKASQLGILVVAAKMGVAEPGKVCAFLQLDPSTLSRNVERMRSRGWLETVEGKDARRQPFRLTTRGRKLLARAIPAWDRGQRQALEKLGGGQWLMEATRKLGP